MGRPQLITDEALLDAARQVFLEQGLHASTEAVAARAGVSQGVVFKRFGSKEDLFHKAMSFEHELVGFFEQADRLQARAGQGDFAVSLTELGRAMLDRFSRMIPLIMMSWANAGEANVPRPFLGKDPPPARVMRRFGQYFSAELSARGLRGPEPMVVARVFLGSLWHFVMLELTIPGQLGLPAEEFLAGLIDLTLHGLRPVKRGAKKKPAPPKKGAKK